MISVVIPALDEAGYLGPTLETLARAREELGLEVIVSDDGSRDQSVELARGLADVVVEPRPGQRTGPGAARNRGAARARGQVLVFLDADSRVCDPLGFFRKVESAFGRGSLVAATSRLKVEPVRSGPLTRAVLFVQDLIIMAENLAGVHVAGGWCQIADREAFFRVGGYDEDLSVSQDVDLFKRLGRLGTTRLLPGLLVYESPRRYLEKGLLRTYLVRAANSLAVLLGRKPPFPSYRSDRPGRHG